MSNLDERIDLLEYQVELLAQIMQDPKHSHFNHIILERKLNRLDVNKIYGLLDMVSENPTATDRDDFLERLSDLIPKFSGDAMFASSILSSLNEDGKYTNVYEYLKYNDASLNID
jgi:Protein of unknown function (DUF1878)